jgi:hypothetical protein
MVTPKKCHKLTLPSPHTLSMQEVLNVGGTWLIKAGDKIVKAGFSERERRCCKEAGESKQTWIYSWMRRGILFQNENEM